MAAITAILGAAFTVGVSVALGSFLLSWLKLEFCRVEWALFAFVSGSGCLSLAVFGLCVIHQARLPVFLAGGAVAIGGALWKARGMQRRKRLPALPRAWTILFAVVYVAFFACYFTNALAPEISPDGSGYHLGNVARDWRHNGFDWAYHSIYSSLGQGMEMLFLVAFSVGRHPAAALVHMAFQATLPILMLCYGRRSGFPRAAAFAGLVVYASPVVGIDGSSAYNDLALATLIFAGFYVLDVKHQKLSYKTIILCGLISGCSYAVKYTAWLTFPFAAVFTRGRRLWALCIGVVAMAGPWMLRNWIWLGNPFAPFLNSWFPNPYWSASAEHEYLAGLREYPHFKSYWDFISQLTVLGGLVPGMIGPVFLLLPLALLALRQPHGRKLLFAGAVYAIPAFFNTDVRFVVPALPFLALALGLALENSWGMLPVVALFQAFLCWPAVMDAYCDPNAWRIHGLPVRAALLPEAAPQYIASHVGDYALRDAIERAVGPNQRIFSFAGRAVAYLDRDIVVGYESSEGMRIQQALFRGSVAEAKSARCNFLLVNDTDAVADDIKQNMNLWGITEVAKANGTTLYRID